ncbi:MAG: DUF3084 domain-containing protein [Oscillatoria princeps RMCB-10]|jgi:uncharacterized protein (DUF3084 family)|nr:DUF3084 domain-containing protein [Oscillatoria princeps RMCB-10]
MTIGYILILSILILGGAIATAGDRIGTKVGKARLSLFNLRPKKTATLVTALTGVTISAMTLGILFATSEPLRKGVFEYDRTQKKLRSARRELAQAQAEKSQVQAELDLVRSEQAPAQQRLDDINRSLQAANAKLSEAVAQRSRTEKQLQETQRQLSQTVPQKEALQKEIEQLQAERQALLQQQERVKAQIALRDRRLAERQLEIAKRDREIAQQDRQIAEQEQQVAQQKQLLAQQEQQVAQQKKLLAEQEQQVAQQKQLLAEQEQQVAQQTQVIAQQETQLKELQTQKNVREREVKLLERDLQVLKEGTIVIRRNQVLASGVLRVVKPSAAPQAVQQLLHEANQVTVKLTQPGRDTFGEPVIQMSRAEVEELIDRIDDGQDYVVRILSAANYLLGEKRVQVFADAAQNQVVFLTGDVVAATSIDPATMTASQLRERIEVLIGASMFRSRKAGVLTETVQVGDGRIETLIRFLEQLQQQNQLVDLKAVAADVTHMAGPLKIELVATVSGEVIFHTCSPNSVTARACA